MLKFHIVDGTGGSSQVKVTDAGQLVIAPYSYNEIKYVLLDTAAAGYTFYSPRVGYQFVLTHVMLTADSNVVTSCIVDIYESVAENSATIGTSLFHFEVLKNYTRDLMGLNVLCSEGVFINGKTDDDDVYMTLLGYYIPTVG